MKQYKQSKNLTHVKSKPELPCCECSSDDEIENKLMQVMAGMTSNKYQSTISNIKSKLSPTSKLYKVTSNELYPLSSSDDSEDSSEDIGVAPLY